VPPDTTPAEWADRQDLERDFAFLGRPKPGWVLDGGVWRRHRGDRLVAAVRPLSNGWMGWRLRGHRWFRLRTFATTADFARGLVDRGGDWLMCRAERGPD
jgi:hypothetical protein